MRASDSTIVGLRRKTVLPALVALLAIAVAGNGRAEPLPFSGTLDVHLALGPFSPLPPLSAPGSPVADVSLAGANHLSSLVLGADAFGPVNGSLPVTSSRTINSMIFTDVANAAGTLSISGGGLAGTLGLSGTMKVCLVFAACAYANITIPLASGFGVGGTQVVPGAVRLTMQHAPWTIGQPAMTIHTPNSNVTTLAFPVGFAHGPASLTSSTAAGGGELQLVTVTKVYSSLTGAFPELPLFATLNLVSHRDSCQDGVDNDGDGLIDWPDDPGCDDAEDGFEQSSALVCDNGLDDDGDTLVDVAEDPGCDDPTDPSELHAAIDCDDGTDNDGDGLVDWPQDPGCEHAGDGSEQSHALVCDNGSDNDGDGLIDWPQDPGCDDSEDPSERSPALICDNGLDDDGDTLVDVADDPGCDDPTDPSEHNPAIDCDDGDDDDGDGQIDWPHDPGCDDAEDGSEQSPTLVCDNGLDDDGDGLVDVAEDPGCDDPNDSSEHTDAIDCDDGADNDDDGLVDILDPGCDDPFDPFEQNCGHVTPLTDNGTEDTAPAVSESRIAWHQWEAGDPEVLLWDGSTVTALTDNTLLDLSPSIAGTMLVWEEWGGSNTRVMRWTGSGAVPLSEVGVDAWSPHTDGAGVVWSQGPSRHLPPEGIYHWDGSDTTRVFGSTEGIAPAISGENIVWETDAGIHMWTGTTTVLIPGSAGGHAPAVSGHQVVWHALDRKHNEIYLWDGSTTQPLTDNKSDDRNADISGNRVVWESAEGIQVWKGGETSLVAGSLGGQLPKIDGIDVVWQALGGSDQEIFLVTLCVACNDGVDNDRDAKIDYDGGFSALGYVAAEPDPQCRDNPWKKNEAAYSPCGLGAELALLLPPLLWLYQRRRKRSL